ncbi:hypothetical protein [Streptomyces dysideae]|nr:hypothetical protein [Streptomyces dysideae]
MTLRGSATLRTRIDNGTIKTGAASASGDSEAMRRLKGLFLS